MSPNQWQVIALAFVVTASVLVVGTGAFSAVTADRTADISVAGDESALLAISPHSSADSDEVFIDNDQLQIEVSPGSTTTYAELFNVTNQGTQPVAVWIEDHDYVGGGESGDLAGDVIGDVDEDNTDNVTFFNPTYGGGGSGNCENGVLSIEGQVNGVEVSPGETLVVGLRANTSDVSGEEADLLDEMTIYADASVSGVSTAQNVDC